MEGERIRLSKHTGIIKEKDGSIIIFKSPWKDLDKAKESDIERMLLHKDIVKRLKKVI